MVTWIFFLGFYLKEKSRQYFVSAYQSSEVPLSFVTKLNNWPIFF